MEEATQILRAVAQRLDTRIGSLQAQSAGPEHLALVRLRYVGLFEVAGIGDRIVQVTDDKAIPVGEAIANAGGSDWIAEYKTFHSPE